MITRKIGRGEGKKQHPAGGYSGPKKPGMVCLLTVQRGESERNCKAPHTRHLLISLTSDTISSLLTLLQPWCLPCSSNTSCVSLPQTLCLACLLLIYFSWPTLSSIHGFAKLSSSQQVLNLGTILKMVASHSPGTSTPVPCIFHEV